MHVAVVSAWRSWSLSDESAPPQKYCMVGSSQIPEHSHHGHVQVIRNCLLVIIVAELG